MGKNLEGLEKAVDSALAEAKTLDDIKNVKALFLGKKGKLTEALKQIATLPVEDKKTWGHQCHQLKQRIQDALDNKKQEGHKEAFKKDDWSLPVIDQRSLGTTHPVRLVIEKVRRIFELMGFAHTDGPEIEDEYHNFEALNIPETHPARGMHDTFYLEKEGLLRTHTSPVQIRVMKGKTPPFFCASSGKVFRRDFDVTHLPMFHQVEGFVVDKGVSFSDLKYVVRIFLQSFFEQDLKVRFRPSYFPFTRPSAEVDISCVVCAGKGCRVCAHTTWLEVAGCGAYSPSCS